MLAVVLSVSCIIADVVNTATGVSGSAVRRFVQCMELLALTEGGRWSSRRS